MMFRTLTLMKFSRDDRNKQKGIINVTLGWISATDIRIINMVIHKMFHEENNVLQYYIVRLHDMK